MSGTQHKMNKLGYKIVEDAINGEYCNSLSRARSDQLFAEYNGRNVAVDVSVKSTFHPKHGEKWLGTNFKRLDKIEREHGLDAILLYVVISAKMVYRMPLRKYRRLISDGTVEHFLQHGRDIALFPYYYAEPEFALSEEQAAELTELSLQNKDKPGQQRLL